MNMMNQGYNVALLAGLAGVALILALDCRRQRRLMQRRREIREEQLARAERLAAAWRARDPRGAASEYNDEAFYAVLKDN